MLSAQAFECQLAGGNFQHDGVVQAFGAGQERNCLEQVMRRRALARGGGSLGVCSKVWRRALMEV